MTTTEKYLNRRDEFMNLPSMNEFMGLVNAEGRIEFKDMPYRERKTRMFPGSVGSSMLEKSFAKTAEYDKVRDCVMYLHTPFCNLRCTYCGFFKNRALRDDVAEYAAHLVEEIRLLNEKGAWKNRNVKAVFFGGGTPSVLSPAEVKLIMDTIHSTVPLSDDCEITFESSIIDMDDEKFAACLESGINRFSFGVQTFNTEVRRKLGRPDAREVVEERLKKFSASPARIIIDLIYGLPYAEENSVIDDIRIGIDCGISGFDLYKLQILPGSPLGVSINEGRTAYKSDNSYMETLFINAHDYAAELGVKRLSCCHWQVKPEEESRYNTLVKHGIDIISAGASCGGRSGTIGFMKMPDRTKYMKDVTNGIIPLAGAQKQAETYVMLDALNGQFDKGILDFTALNKFVEENMLPPEKEEAEDTVEKAKENILKKGMGMLKTMKHMHAQAEVMDKTGASPAEKMEAAIAAGMPRKIAEKVFAAGKKESAEERKQVLEAVSVMAKLDWEELLSPLLNHWQKLDLMKKEGQRYIMTSTGAYWSRYMARVALNAAEHILYGAPEEGETTSGMGGMKNMK